MINKLKSLQNNQGFMKYFKNTSWLFGEIILNMIVELLNYNQGCTKNCKINNLKLFSFFTVSSTDINSFLLIENL
jgi:hypothetical protein